MVREGFSPALALHTIAAISRYVNGFVLQEQTTLPDGEATAPPDPMGAMVAMLDGGPQAVLLQAIRDTGPPLSEAAFEHGLRLLIHGTEKALSRIVLIGRSRD